MGKRYARYVFDPEDGRVHGLDRDGNSPEGCDVGAIENPVFDEHEMSALAPKLGIRPEPCPECKPDLESWLDDVTTEG